MLLLLLSFISCRHDCDPLVTLWHPGPFVEKKGLPTEPLLLKIAGVMAPFDVNVCDRKVVDPWFGRFKMRRPRDLQEISTKTGSHFRRFSPSLPPPLTPNHLSPSTCAHINTHRCNNSATSHTRIIHFPKTCGRGREKKNCPVLAERLHHDVGGLAC